MEEKLKFVFNYTRVTNRALSIVAGSLIISSSFNHEFVVTYILIFTKSSLLAEFDFLLRVCKGATFSVKNGIYRG